MCTRVLWLRQGRTRSIHLGSSLGASRRSTLMGSFRHQTYAVYVETTHKCLKSFWNLLVSEGKSRFRGHFIIVPLHEETEAHRYGTRCQRMTVLLTLDRVYPRMRHTLRAFVFSAVADCHLSTSEGWEAELAYISTSTVRQQSAQNRYG